MASIIIGTTPTIAYTFKTIEVANIAVAYLTIKRGGTVVIRKDLAEAIVGETSLSWTLSQEETLKVGTGTVGVMLNWRLSDGTRGASREVEIRMKGNHIAGVI